MKHAEAKKIAKLAVRYMRLHDEFRPPRSRTYVLRTIQKKADAYDRLRELLFEVGRLP